jgi:hypothetical protein
MNRFGFSKSTGAKAKRLLNGLQPTQLADTVRRDVSKGVRSAGEFIGNNPIVSLSAAFVAGALIAYLVKRT